MPAKTTRIRIPCLNDDGMAMLAYYVLEAIKTMKPWQLVLLSALYDGYCAEYDCVCTVDVPADDELVARGAIVYALTELL